MCLYRYIGIYLYIYVQINTDSAKANYFNINCHNQLEKNSMCDANTLHQFMSSKIQVFGTLALCGSQPTVLS